MKKHIVLLCSLLLITVGEVDALLPQRDEDYVLEV